jgi:hypothetical protein
MPSDAKTVVRVLRDWPEEVAVVIDSTRSGRTAAECADVARETGRLATAPGRSRAGLWTGAPAASRRDHASAA